jgi:serine/threonine-protein kinase RsbW
MKAGTALLGSLTIPGRAEHVAEARGFVRRTLGADCAEADTAILLTSELVTNSIQHSRSRRDGGTITITLIAVPDGIRAEVIDEGGATEPMLDSGQGEPASLAENGRGLQLVQLLSARWSYAHDEAGTVTWFELATSVAQV